MSQRNQAPIALYILHDILEGEGAAALLVARYRIPLFSIKRHLCELRHLGVELVRYDAGSEYGWRCRNAEEVQSSALFLLWLGRHRRRSRHCTRAA